MTDLIAPQVGLEPTTTRLTAECSAIELLRIMESGSDLSSRAVSSQVLSALESLTAVFGMGTGGTSPSLPPEKGWFSPTTAFYHDSIVLSRGDDCIFAADGYRPDLGETAIVVLDVIPLFPG